MTSFRFRLLAACVAFIALGLLALRFRQGLLASTTSLQPTSLGSVASSVSSTDPAICLTPGTTPNQSFADAVAAKTARATALAATAAFENWLTDFRRADPADQPALAAAGVPLATTRRTALKYLIETDPERALAVALSHGLRAELPAAIQAQLEQRLDARGDLEVAIACLGSETRTLRTALIDGIRYQAYVFGRRETQGSKNALPLHGIAVDSSLALEVTPYRVIDDSEKSTLRLPVEQAAVIVGSVVTPLNSHADLTALTDRLVAAESSPGPVITVTAADSGNPTMRQPGTAAVNSPASWVNGEKRVLWLKLEFSDDPGSPALDADLATTATAVSDFFNATSHGKTTMKFVTPPGLVRLTREKAYYNTSLSTTNDLRDDAKAAAKAYDAANGGTGAYDPDKFDRWIMVFKKVPAYTFGGQGALGAAPVWLNGGIGAGVTGHELGHNQSLDHSHAWLPSGSSPIGPGTFDDYGDVFDRMGSSSSSANNFFNVAQKFKLGYLDTASVTTVTAAGTYRLTRHDHKDAAGVRALRVGASNVEYDYWIEHRRLGPTALTTQQLDRVQNGVILHWGPQKLPNFVTDNGSYLLDMTPGSAGGTNDAPLRIGESFTDPNAGITIKPLAVGGTAPNEYIDVQVSFGATDGNRNPVLIADAPAGSLNARTNLTVSASATDPDDDPVYFRWDFGDGKFQPNLNAVTTRFAKGGTYPVTVSAHDGKGGIAVKTYSLNVADPLVTWTKRTSPLTTNNLYDVTFAAGKFVVVGDNGAIVTSPDGTTWSRATTPSNAHFYRSVAHNGSRFATVGVGASGATIPATAAFSNDGATWVAVTLPTGVGTLNSVAYGAGRFVAVGGAGRIYTSVDGAAWTETPSPITTNLRAVTYANNVFVAVGDSGRAVTSGDGLVWANRSLPDSNAYAGITFHNGAWYATSGSLVYTSPDASSWRRVTTKSIVNLFTNKALSTSGVILGAYGEGRIQFSEDGQTWAGVQLDSTTGASIRSLAEGGGALVAVGSTAALYSTTAATLISPPLPAPSMRLEGDSLKLSVGRKNLIAAGGPGYSKLELYANGTKVSEISGQSGVFSWTPPAFGNYALSIRGIDANGASAMSAYYPAQAGLANWNWRNPSPLGSDLNGAVRVDGKWWIVGNTGNFVTLDAAGNFTPVDFATTQNLTGIGYANGRFVVTAPHTDAGSREPTGDPWTSTDGFAWTALFTTDTEAISLNHVINAGGQWLAFNLGGVITSTDGLSWARRTIPVSVALWGAAYGNNLYVIVGAGGKIITSPDGATWTERTSGVATDLRKVAFNNGTFVAAGLSGVILSSTDGLSWTRRTSGVTLNLYGVGVIKGSFVVAGDTGTVLTSTDAATWTPATVENRTTNFLFATGADNEGLLLGRAGEVYTATSATNYKRVSAGTSDNRTAVIFAGGKFVAVGQAIDPLARNAVLAPVMVSTDGATWTRATANSGFTNLNDVTYGQSRYIAVGDTNGLYSSPDALTWTKRTSTSTTNFTCVAASATAFVAGTSGQSIYSSPDGTTWTQRAYGLSSSFRGATYGAGRFVIVGDAGAIYTSVDGNAWTPAASGVAANLLNVAWFDDLGFLAAGAAGTMIGSADGLAWRTIETGITDSISSIAKTPVGYLAPAGTAGTMLVSLDGINWSIRTIPLDRAVRGLAANATTIVAVGDNGATLTFDFVDSTPAPAVTAQPIAQSLLPGAPVRLTVTAQNSSGGAYQWFKDGTPIVGANSPVFTLASISAADLGRYTVALTTPTGTTTSSPAALTFANAANPGRLINLSILTAIAAAPDSFTMGYVVGGTGTVGAKPLVIRAAGPSLGALGVAGTVNDPKLELYAGDKKTLENDNWGGSPELTAALAAVGAFPYTGPGSKDAAVTSNILTRDNSIVVSGVGAGGLVIAELYDATPTPSFTVATPRLINVSVRKHLGDGLTVGFVLGGAAPTKVLIRVVGPSLGAFGVPGTVVDPQLTLFNSASAKIGENNDWGGTGTLTNAFASVGAFALAPTTKDAALFVTLPPGNYSVQAAGVAGTTGVALVEVYEVP